MAEKKIGYAWLLGSHIIGPVDEVITEQLKATNTRRLQGPTPMPQIEGRESVSIYPTMNEAKKDLPALKKQYMLDDDENLILVKVVESQSSAKKESKEKIKEEPEGLRV